MREEDPKRKGWMDGCIEREGREGTAHTAPIPSPHSRCGSVVQCCRFNLLERRGGPDPSFPLPAPHHAEDESREGQSDPKSSQKATKKATKSDFSVILFISMIMTSSHILYIHTLCNTKPLAKRLSVAVQCFCPIKIIFTELFKKYFPSFHDVDHN